MKARVIVISALGWLSSLSFGELHASGSGLPALLTNDDTVNRLRKLDPYIKNLPPKEVPATLKLAIAGHGPGRENAIDALSGRWVELDAPAALAFARQTSDREAGDSIEDAFYGAWAARDADGALKAANQAGGGERGNAIWQIAHKIGARDPRRANELIKSVQGSNLSDSDYFIFWNWAESDLSQANQTVLEEAKVAGPSYPCESAVWAITDRLSDDNPKFAAGWVGELSPGKLYDEAFARLLEDWTKIDRDATAAWLGSLPTSDQVRNAILNLPRKGAGTTPLPFKVDPSFSKKAAQLDKILWESNFWFELDALLPFVDGLKAAEFPQALAQLRNAQDSNRDTVAEVIIKRWSEVDLAGMTKTIPLADTIHDMEFRNQTLSEIYAAWAQREPEAAFAAATNNDHGVGNCDVLQAIFAALARRDPAIAYTLLRKLNDANSQSLITPIFTEWAARDLPAATEALSHEGHPDGAIEGIVIGLMRKGPPAAIAWAEHLPDATQRGRALRDVALRWPDNPEAEAAWLEKSPAFDGKDSAYDDLAVDWAVRDPMEALHHAMTLADGAEKSSLLDWGLQQLTYDDAEAAVRFAQQLPGDEARKNALSTVLGCWDEFAPMAAATFLTSMATEATPDEVAQVAGALSDGTPVAAVHWLDALPGSVDKTQAIRAIAKNWHATDAAAAEQWVKQQPAGPRYDEGAGGICDALNADLAPALKWGRSIGDTKICHDAVYQAFKAAVYFRMRFFDLSDPQGIKGQIQSASELNDAEKKTLLAGFPMLQIIQGPQPINVPPPLPKQ